MTDRSGCDAPLAERVLAALDGDVAAGDDVRQGLEAAGIPALSVAVAAAGRVRCGAWGVRRPGGREPVSPGTRLLAGSVSKPVTASAALRLVGDGLLGLDEDVNRHLRRWRLTAADGTPQEVSLRALLSHTAGTTVSGFPGYRRTEAVPDVVGVLAGRGNTPAVVVDGPPGQYRYSGGGTTVVQLLLEELTGRSFADALDDLVLRPAGMTTASFAQPPPEALHGTLAEGVALDGTAVPGGWHVYPEAAAAGLWCTPADLVRWALAVQGRLDGAPPLLPPDLVQQMLSAQVPGTGLGPRVHEVAGRSHLGHGGADEGFLTLLDAVAGTDEAVAVMASSGAAGPLLQDVASAAGQALGWGGVPQYLPPTPSPRGGGPS